MMGNVFAPSYSNPLGVLEQLKFPPSFVFPKFLFNLLNSLLLLYEANKTESNYGVKWVGETEMPLIDRRMRFLFCTT